MATIIKSKRIRSGLYEVMLDNGNCYKLELFNPADWDDVESDPMWRITKNEWLDLGFGDGFKWYNSDDGCLVEWKTKAECMKWLKNWG